MILVISILVYAYQLCRFIYSHDYQTRLNTWLQNLWRHPATRQTTATPQAPIFLQAPIFSQTPILPLAPTLPQAPVTSSIRLDPCRNAPVIRLYYTVCFVNGSNEERKFVKRVVEDHYHAINMSVRFKFLDDLQWNGPCAIRIRFTDHGYSCSHLGLLNLSGQDPNNLITMWLSLGGLNEHRMQRVVLHEFGHALGLDHQHQHPDSGIEWRESALRKSYQDMSKEAIRFNFIDKVDRLALIPYDRDSIMHYSVALRVAPNLTTPIEMKAVLSEGDKKLLISMYPPQPFLSRTRSLVPGAVVELHQLHERTYIDLWAQLTRTGNR